MFIRITNMKKTVLLFVSMLAMHLVFSKDKNLLSGKYSKQELQSMLIPLSTWTPFPKITDRSSWSKADQAMMKAYLQKAEGYIHYNWPSIPATTSLLIERTGDRAEYESISFEKRQVLGTLV